MLLTGVVSLAAICLSVFASSVPAQTLLVNYDFASLNPGTPCTAMPRSTATNVTSIFSTGGSGGGTCAASLGIPSYVSYAFADNDDNPGVKILSTSADSKDYFQFQLNGVSAFRDYKLFFQAQRINSIDVQYSLDGVNFTDFKRLYFGQTLRLYFKFSIDLSSIAEIQNQPTVYIRVQSNTGAPLYNNRFDIDNFQVQATATVKKRKRVRFIDPSLATDSSR